MVLELKIRPLLKVATPIMMGGFVQFVLTFVDTAFLGHLGELQLNTAGNAGLIYITLFLVAQGLSDALQIKTSRRLGEGNTKALKNLFWNSLVLLSGIALLSFVLVGYGAEYFLPSVTRNPQLSESMSTFLRIRSVGYFFSITQLALIGFYSGTAKTNILGYSTAILALVNLVFDYFLIYGIGFFPEMGMYGAALASVIAEAVSLVFSIFYLRSDKRTMTWVRFTGFVWVKNEVKQLLKLAFPIMGQRFLAMTSWTIFFFLIEKMGPHDLAISQLIRSLYFLAFIPIMGFGTATKTYVSNFMARKRFDEVQRSLWFISLISWGILLLTVHGFLLYPEAILSILTDDDSLVRDSKSVLQLIFFEAQLFMVASVVFNAIAGVGDTRMAFIIENVCITIYLVATYFITVVYPQDIFTVWCMEFVYFGSLLIASILYFKWYPWQKILV